MRSDVLPLEAEICKDIELAELKEEIYNYGPLLREDLILKLPSFVECKDGNCPERENIKKFIKGKDTYFPFNNFKFL